MARTTVDKTLHSELPKLKRQNKAAMGSDGVASDSNGCGIGSFITGPRLGICDMISLNYIGTIKGY